jgi:hypothetical protein
MARLMTSDERSAGERWEPWTSLMLLLGIQVRLGVPVGWMVTGSAEDDSFFPFVLEEGHLTGTTPPAPHDVTASRIEMWSQDEQDHFCTWNGPWALRAGDLLTVSTAAFSITGLSPEGSR